MRTRKTTPPESATTATMDALMRMAAVAVAVAGVAVADAAGLTKGPRDAPSPAAVKMAKMEMRTTMGRKPRNAPHPAPGLWRMGRRLTRKTPSWLPSLPSNLMSGTLAVGATVAENARRGKSVPTNRKSACSLTRVWRNEWTAGAVDRICH
jgi:hypothetical protein